MGTMKKIRKFTIELPADLWKRASHRAVDEETTLKALIVEALEALLAARKEKKS
jgi:hypothetical protein